jgi:dihydroxyacid dehydratase/phosphogluconate dehydratase
MTALYLERYLNYGFTRSELQGGKPIIGIAQTGSDLSPATAPMSTREARARRHL